MMDPLRHVKFFAATKHAGQKYGDGQPYTVHLAAVEEVLRRFPIESRDLRGQSASLDVSVDDLLEAAWLHDVVEDTNTTLAEVEGMFGPRVAALVWAVTNEPGPNRRARHALTYPKIRAQRGATLLKLADRIANVEAGGKLVEMYCKEYVDFTKGLRVWGEFPEFWAHLGNLLSPCLTEQHKTEIVAHVLGLKAASEERT